MENKENNNVEKKEEEMEQWTDVKKGNSSIFIIIVLVLIVIALGVFIYLNKDKLFQVVESNSNTTEQKNTKQNDNKTTDTEDKETESVEETIKPLDLTKCLNCGENWVISDATETDESKHFTIKNDNNLKLAINWATFCQFSGASDCSNEVVEYDIRGVSKKIQSTIVGGSGQSINSTTFYYLLEDGTVEYTKLYNKNKDSQGNNYYAINYSYDNNQKDSQGNPTTYFASQGTVPNVKNVIKLYNVQVHEQNGGGHATTIGAKSDGSFYDLKVE